MSQGQVLSGSPAHKNAAVLASDSAPDESQERYLNRDQLLRIFPVTEMTIWRWTRDAEIAFPAPVKLGADGRNFWWLPAVMKWADTRAARTNQHKKAGGRHLRREADASNNPGGAPE